MKNKRLRLDGITGILQLEEKTTLQALAARFDVSTATIRRDIKLLENSGQVYQGKGGEVLYHKDYPGPPREAMLSKFINEKIRISEYCSTLIKEQETIIIGPGVITTLAGRIFSGLDFQFRVITNSLTLSLELSELENISLFMLGGEIEKQYSTIKNFDRDPMDGIKYADKLFMTADGIDAEYGLTYFESSRIPVINGMMGIAKEIILLADSSKFGNVCFNYLCGFSKIDRIITDNGINKNIKKAFSHEGINLTMV
ncbi:MAG: DeoR/GlpR family DNA-binding transcription regulator [Spirochaetales bacterium]|uniref:DeoR/GlpR family DNA-binding transcription regulator n=1 Tax=Candidatus Thalassospirochaeta sargassi TaxID=3119039 RepID=A0AAJ1IG55_9SPIO|nr:DeoR/GlpR family DNA-binding transcription regulator [Spirochaetales bacterium]